jgi:hypothetical protein
MDGLDIYIDDYTKPDPIPEGFLDKLADVYKTVEEKAAEAAPVSPTVADAQTASTTVAADPAPASGTSAPHQDQEPDEHPG